MSVALEHIKNAGIARDLYLNNLKSNEAAADWHFTKREARKLVASSLRASNYLCNLPVSLQANGGHTRVYRQMLAPPMSQDQFRLVCREYSKTAENNGRPIGTAAATAVANVITERFDKGLAAWVGQAKGPTRQEVVRLLHVTSTLMAIQKIATARRSRLAKAQEYAVEVLLTNNGWTKLPSKLIDTRAAVPPKSYMRKTRFATETTAPQEVDIACGLERSDVLAMECKVTNDETNSVKRINDVLKKATAWKAHWGSFVITAALLQGVVAPKDVQRLTDAGVHVFWSHDLAAFETWLKKQMA